MLRGGPDKAAAWSKARSTPIISAIPLTIHNDLWKFKPCLATSVVSVNVSYCMCFVLYVFELLQIEAAGIQGKHLVSELIDEEEERPDIL